MNRIKNLTSAATLSLIAATGAVLSMPAFTQPAAAAASPLDRGWISEDATWLIHVDVERLLSTDIGRWLAREIEQADFEAKPQGENSVSIKLNINEDDEGEHDANQVVIERDVTINADDPDAAAQRVGLRADQALALESLMPQSLREFRERYKFDPFKDVLAITVYGDESGERPDTVLVHTTAAIDNAVKELQTVDGLDISHFNGTTVGQFHPHDPTDEPTIVAVRPEPDGTRMMFFANSLEGLADVLEPQGKGKGPGWAAPGADSFIYIHTTKNSPLFVEAERSQLLRGAESIEINIGQRVDQLFVRGNLHTQNKEIATQMVAIANGLVAVANLSAVQDNADPESKAILNLIKDLAITSNGSTVNLDLNMNASNLMNLIETNVDFN